jgi:hypothetical protein
MRWQDIVARDPFLAGSLVARERDEWQEGTPFAEMDSIGLVGEARQKFLSGWEFEIVEQQKERKAGLEQERDKMLDEAAGKGDPAT